MTLIKEGQAKRILSSKRNKELSLRNIKWEFPDELIRISKEMKNQYETFIGIGRWKNINTKMACLVTNGEVIYLEPEIIKVLFDSIQEGAGK